MIRKIVPFIFPVTSLLIVIFLTFRWYAQRNEVEYYEDPDPIHCSELGDLPMKDMPARCLNYWEVNKFGIGR